MAGMPEFESGVRAADFAVARPTINTSEAEGIFRLADTAGRITQTLAASAIEQGTQDAANAGAAQMIYEQQPDGTQRLRPLEPLLRVPLGSANRAFNAAVTRNYMMAVETDARQSFGRFQTENQTNPSGFMAAADGWINRTVDALPESARGAARTQLMALATGFSSQISERINRAAQDQIFATATVGVQSLADDADRLSRANPADPRIAQARERYRQALEDLKTTHPDRVNDVVVRDGVRLLDRTIEGNRFTNEAIGLYRRGGGLQAAERAIEAYGNRSDLPFTTAERDQIMQRARAAVRDLESQRQQARALDQQANADQVRDLVTRGQLAAQQIDPRNTAAGERNAGEYAAQGRNQEVRNQVYLLLNNGPAAEHWRQVDAQRQAVEQLNALTMSQRNAQDIAAGRPPSFPLTQMMQTLPPQMWPQAQATILHAQEQAQTRATQQADLMTEIHDAATGRRTTTSDRLSQYVDIMYPGNGGGQRVAADMTNPAQREDVIRLAVATGVLPRQVNDVLTAGLAPTATFVQAQRAALMFDALRRDQNRLPAVDAALGENRERLARLSTDVSAIAGSGQSIGPNGQVDPQRTETAWRSLIQGRHAAGLDTEDGVNRRLAMIFGNNHAEAISQMARDAITQRTQPDEPPISGVAGLDFPGPGNEQVTGIPVSRPWMVDIPGIGRIGNPLFNWSASGTVPIALGPNDVPAGYDQAFARGVRQAAANGETNQQALMEAGRREASRTFQPTFLGSPFDDRAVVSAMSIEARGREMGLTPQQVTEQVVQSVSSVITAMQNAGERINMRTQSQADVLAALARKEIFVQPVPGTERDPRWYIMYRPVDQNGLAQPVERLLVGPRSMQADPTMWTINDAPVISLRPDQRTLEQRTADEARSRAAYATVDAAVPGLPQPSREMAAFAVRLGMRITGTPGAAEVQGLQQRARDAAPANPTPPDPTLYRGQPIGNMNQTEIERLDFSSLTDAQRRAANLRLRDIMDARDRAHSGATQ